MYDVHPLYDEQPPSMFHLIGDLLYVAAFLVFLLVVGLFFDHWVGTLCMVCVPALWVPWMYALRTEIAIREMKAVYVRNSYVRF